MRYPIALSFVAISMACQPAPQRDVGSPTAGAGTTTYTRGNPSVTRSETTRVRGEPASQTGGGATLTLDRTSYAAGATVTMRITSQTRDTLGYNQCSSRVVERQDGERWVAHPEPDRMCTMELRLLMPGESQTATTDLPANLRSGTYRIVLSLSPQSAAATRAGVRAVSPAFRVN